MKSIKQLGIWMDHSIANLIELTNDTPVIKTVESQSNYRQEKPNLKKDENLMQNKEQGQLSEYFKRLSDVIIEYQEVLLFGPTDAKTELLNKLKDNHQFEKIKIVVKTADKMTENQKHAFVREYFKKD
jgi:ADP-heptose:LPS heptosyltransferase